MFKNRYVKFGFGIILSALVVLMCFLFSNQKINRIDGIENYENVFQSVDELKFFIEGNNFYSTKSPSKELRKIKRVRINSEPLSAEENENREFKYKITIDDKYIIFINSDFSRLWLDDKNSININYNEDSWYEEVDEGVLPSFSDSIENPEVLDKLFQEHSQHINK